MPSQSRFQKSSAIPLRSDTFSAEFTPSQMGALGAFIASLAMSGHGTYCNVLQGGRTMRLKIYADGETYEDNLFPGDDFAMLLGQYAKQFKCQGAYMQVLAALHGGAAGRQSEAPEEASEGQDTGAGRTKRLRPS